MNEQRRINVRLDPDFFDKLDQKRFRSKLSFQGLMSDLLRGWLEGTIDLETRSGSVDVPVEVPYHLKPHVIEFARWLSEPVKSDKEAELKNLFRKMFDARVAARRKRV